MKLFGFELKKEKPVKSEGSFVLPSKNFEEEQITLNSSGFYNYYLDLDAGSQYTKADLIKKYRKLSEDPITERAIDEIINELIVVDDNESFPLKLDLSKLEDISDKNKEIIHEEFNEILKMMNFNLNAYDYLRSFYVDGRIFFHKVVGENEKEGIKDIRFIDPIYLRKIKTINQEKKSEGILEVENEFYIYDMQSEDNDKRYSQALTSQEIRIKSDAIAFAFSGVRSSDGKKIVSNLHSSLRIANMLRIVEDSLVIYRYTRAPERRVFYIDTGNLPTTRANEYMKNIQRNYANSVEFNPETGGFVDEKSHKTMTQDFWIPRIEGSRGTEISTLPGGQNLGDIADIEYFERKYYKSLKCPIQRLNSESTFSLGRTQEITREEVLFQKFTSRLRRKFNTCLIDLLKTQCILKGHFNQEEWENIEHLLLILYMTDNSYAELKKTEVLRDRVSLVNDLEPLRGTYYSKEFIRKEILKQTDEEVKEIDKAMEKEKAEEPQDETQDTAEI